MEQMMISCHRKIIKTTLFRFIKVLAITNSITFSKFLTMIILKYFNSDDYLIPEH